MNVEDIKYKLYIKEEKTVYQIHAIDIDFNSSDFDMTILYGNNTVRVPFYSHEVVLLPFTGFHDKNGKEIYEGDLLKMNGGELFEVIYDTKIGRFILIEKIWSVCPDTHDIFVAEEMKIIGNVWENPELLKE